MKKLIILALIFSCSLISRVHSENSRSPIDNVAASEFDCTGKSEGNYPHPTDCTRYMKCSSSGSASDQPCPDCPDDAPQSCHDLGFKVFEAENGSCVLPDQATSPCLPDETTPGPGESSTDAPESIDDWELVDENATGGPGDDTTELPDVLSDSSDATTDGPETSEASSVTETTDAPSQPEPSSASISAKQSGRAFSQPPKGNGGDHKGSKPKHGGGGGNKGGGHKRKGGKRKGKKAPPGKKWRRKKGKGKGGKKGQHKGAKKGHKKGGHRPKNGNHPHHGGGGGGAGGNKGGPGAGGGHHSNGHKKGHM